MGIRVRTKFRLPRLQKRTLLFAAALYLCTAAQAKWTTIKNGILWYDNQKNIVEAHGGNFLRVGDKWYMIGEDRTHIYNPDVNLYSTKDFVNWQFEGKIIENGITSKELGGDRMIERPKLLYCKKTGKFVVWCHWEAKDYSASEAAVFTSDKIGGPYTYLWTLSRATVMYSLMTTTRLILYPQQTRITT